VSIENPRETKRVLRAAVRERRGRILPAERAVAEVELAERLTTLVADLGVSRVAAFIPTETEPPITAGLEALAARGIDILLPISRPDRTMDWARHLADEEFSVDELGMPAPVGAIVERATVNAVELVLCPAALVDESGYRLGWGLGYYDRFLAALPQNPAVFAVVFDEDVVDAVPRESHDHPVSGVLTPTRVLRF
jgi:5-formyltetrahydrofolate cyclo-ligase